MVKRNQDEKEAKIQELYSGGRSKELIWIAHLDDACYNKPIETALWNNNEDDLKALRSPPEWKPSYDKRILPNKWSRVVSFGHKWFPAAFGTQQERTQQSVAVQFNYLFKQKCSEWYQMVKGSVTGDALTEIRKLGPDKVEKARSVVKQLQGQERILDYTMLEKALMDTIFFHNPKIELKERKRC